MADSTAERSKRSRTNSGSVSRTLSALDKAQKVYADFVRKEGEASPWQSLNGLDISCGERTRGDWMREAYREHGYIMQEIATFAGLHHSTVSRLIKIEDENPRNKP